MTETALRERLELMAKVFDTLAVKDSLYSRTIREVSAALQAAETRAQQAEARVEELTAALHGMRQAFGDPLTRRALGGHNERQQLAMTAARQALRAHPK